MKLGILVTTDKHLEHVLGIARAALAKRHEVSVFLMDTGTHLVADPTLTGLAQLPGGRPTRVHASFHRPAAGCQL